MQTKRQKATNQGSLEQVQQSIRNAASGSRSADFAHYGQTWRHP